MSYTGNRHIIIIEGPDASGKSSLNKHIQDMCNGKCHTIHSNFNKYLPKDNHFRQHKIITDFVVKQFDSKNYTGNNIVILDRNYASDIVYGTIGYGSAGNLKQKYRKLKKMLNKLSGCRWVTVSFIYCCPSINNFDVNAKAELLTEKQNDSIREAYDKIIHSRDFQEILKECGVRYLEYDFTKDPDYKAIDEKF